MLVHLTEATGGPYRLVLGQRDLEHCERLAIDLAEDGESRDRDRFNMKAFCSI